MRSDLLPAPGLHRPRAGVASVEDPTRGPTRSPTTEIGRADAA